MARNVKASNSNRRRAARRRHRRLARAQLVIVANRLPINRVMRGGELAWEMSAGGLVTALKPVLVRQGGAWVGWTGSAGRSPAPFTHDAVRIRPIRLTEREIEAFYHGFSNRVLWPLFHLGIRAPEFLRQYWQPFVEVNRRFARAAVRAARPTDLIWVHDYHLQLVPGMVRELRQKARVGFFLHIPFPPEELFAWLPWRQWILKGLLGADVIGFQTTRDSQNFMRVAKRYCGAEGGENELTHAGRRVQVRAMPISIDVDEFESLARQPDVLDAAMRIRRRIGVRRKIILSVDRLDYTKGIDVRLQAFEELLRRGRKTVRECVMIQIAVPSRESVREYADIRETIERTVGHINGEYSQPGQVAVHYFYRALPRHELVAYYRAADIMLVTPLCDGMNLVAKEYVATRWDNTGVLVLSEFAGAAKELRKAVMVNPRDVEGVASTLHHAMHMTPDDAMRRMATLRMVVRRADVYKWADDFLSAAAE